MSHSLAFTGISDCHAFRGDVGVAAIPSREAFSKARQAAREALQIDDSLAEAHASLAHATMHFFEWLERAYLERAEWMVYLSVDPRFDPLRLDPRFLSLLARIGFQGKGTNE